VDYKGMILKGKIPAGDFLVELESVDGEFPDWRQVLPDGDPVFEISLNPKLLINALKGMVGAVRVRFYGSSKPVEVIDSSPDDLKYALIMPLRMSTSKP
jgi:DNA polymerase III sliding clamp (beta) subunit (PCNA family)